MRWYVALVIAVIAGCGFDKPRDRCAGPCGLYALDRSIAHTGDLLTLDGTFEDGALVDFPGGARVPLAYRGAHRANVQVPETATAGELAVTMPDGYTNTLPFRRVPFDVSLSPFRHFYEQADVARHNAVPAKWFTGATTVLLGQRLYLIGGIEQSGAVNTVRLAVAGADGAIDDFRTSATSLVTPRGKHASLVIGHYVYVFGGQGPGGDFQDVERAEFDHDGVLGPFSVVQGVRLTQPRSALAAVVIGDYVYLLGGSNGGRDLADVERARILENGDLETFSMLSEIPLTSPRSAFTAHVIGNYLYVIGGSNGGVPSDLVERIEISAEGYLGGFEPAGHMLTPHAGHVSFVLGNGLYVVGGRDAVGEVDTVESAAILADQTPLATLVFSSSASKLFGPRNGAALAVVSNYVYLVGGTYTVNGIITPAQTIERATIVDQGELDGFYTVADTKLVEPRMNHASVVVGSSLYVIGGIGASGAVLGSIERAPVAPDGTVGTFETAPISLRAPRAGHSVFVAGNDVYVVGGTDGSTSYRSIERAPILDDGSLGQFETFAVALGLGRSFHATILTGTYTSSWLHVLGGEDSTGPITSVEFSILANGGFDPFQDIAPLPVARRGFTVAVLGSYAYDIGGRDQSSVQHIGRAPLVGAEGSVQSFASFINMRRGREMHASAVVGNSLYILGGGTGSLGAYTERAKIASDGTFTTTTGYTYDLITQRYGHTAVVVGNYLYVIGGTSNETNTRLDSLERSLIR